MHEMLSLQHLFAGDSDLGTVKKIMEMKIPGPAAHRPDVPAELERIVMRALERDRRNRFATAAEMARALDDFVVASQLHLEEVAAFVREIEAISPLARPALCRERRARAVASLRRREPTERRDADGRRIVLCGLRMRRLRPLSVRTLAAAHRARRSRALGVGTAVGLTRSATASASEPTTAAISRGGARRVGR